MFAIRFDGSLFGEGKRVDSGGEEEEKQDIEDVMILIK